MDVVLGLGSVVWHFDPNRRVYDYPRGFRVAGPARRPQWVEWEIRGETSRSWIAVRKDSKITDAADLGAYGAKIPKKATAENARKMGFVLTAQDVEDDVWQHEHRYRVVTALEQADVATLRKVAELIGYTDDEAER